MSNYIEKAENLKLPVVVLNGAVAFPSVKLNLEITDPQSIAAIHAACATNSFVLLVASRDILTDGAPAIEQLYRVGTVAKVKQTIKTPDKGLSILVEGYSRASVLAYSDFADYVLADAICKTVSLPDDGGLRGEALVREAIGAMEDILKYMPSVSPNIVLAAKNLKTPGLVADFIASNILVRYTDKQEILECFDPLERVETLILLLENEAKLLDCEYEIHRKVKERLSRAQRDHYLHEQIRAIKEELGEGADSETAMYAEKIMAAKMPDEVREKLLRENEKVDKMPFGSAEASVIRNYIDVCLALPWSKKTRDRTDIAKAKKILDQDHDGLEKVKERILEFLAVKQLSPDLKNQILCLIGPPGVGKTSVAISIARAMNRKYVRVSLGGVRDEADIRGHRKTYIASMPGRIMTAISNAEVSNPLILLDEIDKLGNDFRGDPASALLEVLDSEQNKSFRDHFIEFPFDLSDCIFIATANSYENIPRPLLDRMEVIELKIYTKREKLEIAKNHLIPKQLKRHGLTARKLKITEGALCEIVDFYTREAGVRNLERTVADLCRKAAKRILEENKSKIVIDTADIVGYLGPRKRLPDTISTEDEVGVVNGLAYTELGGDMLKIEVAVLEGTGKIETTGSLGDVMQESAKLAVSYVRSIAREYGIPTDFYKTRDIHIHAPEGAVPKDGPSAGVTMTTALVSALTGRAVRRDIAMTGEITLRGNVLAIGGLKEKTMAAYNAGVKRVIIPADNVRDLEEIDPLARENLEFIPCRKLSEVLREALVPAENDGVTEGEKLPEILPEATRDARAPVR